MVKSWLLGNRTVSVPFASFCAPLVSTLEEFNLLLPQIQDVAKNAGSRKIEIRSRQTVAQLAASAFTASVGYKHHYLPLDKSAEALFASFSKSSVRQMVNKASRAGVGVEERKDEEGMRICHAILVETRRRLSLPPMPLAFFQAMQRRLGPDHIRVYLAIQEGKSVGCLLVLRFKELWTAEYSGNTASAIHGVNQLLYWDTIKRAQASGAKWFSFGRTSVNNVGLLAYKRRWATAEEDLVDFTNVLGNGAKLGSAVIESRETSMVYRVLAPLLGKAPMPVYRLIGDFCYRHLG
jgi:lipid II:glycine glycyltransferase (peptidoglycan interpeptide bridge formation enzyme)